MVMVPTPALQILSDLGIRLLRASKIAGLQILAQGLEFLIELRHRSAARGSRSCGGSGGRY